MCTFLLQNVELGDMGQERSRIYGLGQFLITLYEKNIFSLNKPG